MNNPRDQGFAKFQTYLNSPAFHILIFYTGVIYILKFFSCTNSLTSWHKAFCNKHYLALLMDFFLNLMISHFRQVNVIACLNVLVDFHPRLYKLLAALLKSICNTLIMIIVSTCRHLRYICSIYNNIHYS